MRPEQSRAARGLGRRSCWLDSSGPPAGKLLLTEPLQVSHDRVDDLPVLLELVCRLDLPILLDQCLGGHGLHQGLSNGWLAAVWLVYILSEGDHSKDHRPDLAQLKLTAAAAQPGGQLVACDVLPGQVADDPQYLPLIDRVRRAAGQTGLLYVGN